MMFIDGNAKAGSAKIYRTEKELLLEKEIARLKQMLASAREVIGFYGDTKSWQEDLETLDLTIIKDDTDIYDCAGFRARQWLSEHKVG